MPQKNKTNNSKKNLANYRTRTRTQPTITHTRYSVVFRPEQDPPHRARITAGGDRIRTILDTGATAHFIPFHEW
jgi:flagellar basal body rod protein FlgC